MLRFIYVAGHENSLFTSLTPLDGNPFQDSATVNANTAEIFNKPTCTVAAQSQSIIWESCGELPVTNAIQEVDDVLLTITKL